MPQGKGTYGTKKGRPPLNGEKMRKAGSAGAPTKANFKRSAKTAKKK